MRHIAPSCYVVILILTVSEEIEMHGGRSLCTLAKKKLWAGRRENLAVLGPEFSSLLSLKLPYLNSIFLCLIQLWPQVFKTFSVLPLLSLFYLLHILFFFSHLCISGHIYKLNPSSCLLLFLYLDSLWVHWMPRKHGWRDLMKSGIPLLCPKAFYFILYYVNALCAVCSSSQFTFICWCVSVTYWK